MSAPTPMEIVHAARDGDMNALGVLYDTYAPMVYSVVLRLMVRVEDAEDLVQDIFVGLGRALRTYEGRGSFDAWLRRVATRAALMQLRGQRRRREVHIDVDAHAVEQGQPSPPDRLALEAALRRLPEPLRLVFVLKAIEGYSHAEVGELLGIGEGSSKARFYRARRRLRKLLEGGL